MNAEDKSFITTHLNLLKEDAQHVVRMAESLETYIAAQSTEEAE